MKKFENKITGATLTEKEYVELIEREAKDAWKNDLNNIVDEFKEDGKTFEEYLEYVKKYDIDTDFEVVEEEA